MQEVKLVCREIISGPVSSIIQGKALNASQNLESLDETIARERALPRDHRAEVAR